MKCLQTNRAIKSALLVQIAVEKGDSGAHGTCLSCSLLIHLCTKQTLCFKYASTPAAYSFPPQIIPPFDDIAVGLREKYYNPVVDALLSNKAPKHQYWLTSHQKLLSKLSVEWQQRETLADGHANLGELALFFHLLLSIFLVCGILAGYLKESH